ncbi:PREDICTED: capZ-interacting protein isoform X2 [Colobus angolensis palliatus]|uniref:capZ-interacting protein isoform X2 n=1 Tax=Colobus angolensis palliatus TaxID=336983 RepID=UPI0005F4CF50|nr:PREDICTED: capZ-interacting protein isoform X2 [Colobus angolensis palliatus]
MEERPAETNANVDNSASPSVAQLAGRFREQAAAAKEKSPPNASHPPKFKVKSSPLIEKLQANLTFDPAALLPGASPKSPGLKAMVSPFHSPPSTPSSPGVRSRPSEAEEVPVSFDQPPEGSHLPCYNKVRTRGSIKRRPPSRRFRRSQSDCGELGDFRAAESSQENGAKEEDGDEVFPSKSKAPGSPSSSEGAAGEGVRTLGPAEKPPLRRSPSRTEKQEEDRATEEAKNGEKARRSSEDVDGQHPAREEAPEAPQTSGPEAENRCGSPREEKPAGEEEEMEKAAEVKGERVQNEEAGPEQESQETKKPEEGAAGKETPHSPPGGVKGGDVPKQEKGKEKQQEGAVLEPGCSPQTAPAQLETSSEVQSEQAVPKPEVGGLAGSHAEVSARTRVCVRHMPCSIHPFINQLNMQKQRCQAPASCQLVGERLSLRLRGQKDTKGKCVLRSCQLLADLGVLASFWVCVE